jgi:cytochrome P450
MQVVTSHAGVRSILTDPAWVVPPAQPDGTTGTLAWLRASVPRFCSGADHERRRALAERELGRIEPDALRRAAAERTLAVLAAAPKTADLVALVARPVPLATLASALGVSDADLDVVTGYVPAVAAAYQPGASEQLRRDADTAVGRLLRVLGPDPDEAAAGRIGLLVQACDATAGLVANTVRQARDLHGAAAGWPVEALVEETLRFDPPARGTRRQAGPGGETVLLDLAAANRDPAAFADPDRFDPGRGRGPHLAFGHGLRPCPGAAHAVALACGVVEAVLGRAR